MNCRDAYRFVRCGFVYVIVCYGAAFMYAAAQLCGRAYVVPCCRALVMLPRTGMLPLVCGAAHSHTAALHSAAHLYVAASYGAARAAKWSQFSVLPRPMVPRGRPNGLSSLCCRVPWCRVPCGR